MPSMQLSVKRLRKLVNQGDTPSEVKEDTEKLLSEAVDDQIIVDLSRVPVTLLERLVDDQTLSMAKRDEISTLLAIESEIDKLMDQTVRSVKEVHVVFKGLERGKPKEPNAEFFFLGRWYPIRIESRYFSGMFGSFCWVTGTFSFADMVRHKTWGFSESDFINRDGVKVPRKIRDLMKEEGLRPMQQNMQEFAEKIRRADALAKQTGSVRSARGAALIFEKYVWWTALEEIQGGTPELPKKVVVESELEVDERTRNNLSWYDDNSPVITLPLVRVFSLEKKRYIYLDVDDLPEHEFDLNVLDRLVLPPKVDKVLRQVFKSDVNNMFGDLMKGKSGGMIILAHGGTGVGKTLTAEIFAEHTKRPLYVLEVAELGVSPGEVEQNLARILKRAERWNAEVLFDECDLFLAKRDEQQLLRSAIVCVFLRLLDYNKGLMFMTTNRGEVLDPALKSRVTIYLKYPDLDDEARKRIWISMLEASGLKLNGDIARVAKLKLNGRQIRNQVRLMKVLFESEITDDQIIELSEYAAQE